MLSVKLKLSRHKGGGSKQCHQMTQGGGGGSKIGQKSVKYYLNGPLVTFLAQKYRRKKGT